MHSHLFPKRVGEVSIASVKVLRTPTHKGIAVNHGCGFRVEADKLIIFHPKKECR